MEQDMTGARVARIADGAMAAEGTAELGEVSLAGSSSLLARSTTAAMGRLLRAFGDEAPLDGHLQDAARLLARDAHRHALTASQMIVAARGAWDGLPELRTLVPDDDVRALSSRMISGAIKEFYGAPSAPRTAGDESRPTS